MTSINKKEWDYTQHAKHYDSRPNYAPEAIAKLLHHIGAGKHTIVADIGAGTGNLTMLLRGKVGQIFSVEPNQAMREIGIGKTHGDSTVHWSVGAGEDTRLADGSVELAAFGSSFNCTDRNEALAESHRILKKGGYFTCMWNNRDLEEPTQKKVESIIRRFFPDYSHGTRREPQADVILASGLFNHVYYFEVPQEVEIPLETYLDGWKSVKNQFWDAHTPEGKEQLDLILDAIREEFEGKGPFKLVYVTRVWVAKRVD